MFQYNQTKHIEKVLNGGFSKKYMKMELRLLAVYYRDLGKKPKERKELLYKICKKHIEDFNRVKFFKEINSAVNYSTNKKNKIIDVECIPITGSELSYIDNLDLDVFYKKILFTLLVKDKLKQEVWRMISEQDPNGEHYFKNNDKNARKLVKTADITLSSMRKYGHSNIFNIIHYFIELRLIEDTIENIKLLYIYDIPKDDCVVMKIRDYENIGIYYDLHIGKKNIKACKSCDKPIKVRSNRTKYCVECAKEKEKENVRARVRKHRDRM